MVKLKVTTRNNTLKPAKDPSVPLDLESVDPVDQADVIDTVPFAIDPIEVSEIDGLPRKTVQTFWYII